MSIFIVFPSRFLYFSNLDSHLFLVEKQEMQKNNPFLLFFARLIVTLKDFEVTCARTSKRKKRFFLLFFRSLNRNSE